MPEVNCANASAILEKQRAVKPRIEDVIPEYLDGDVREAALSFAAHLRANRMQPVWCLANAWKAVYKGKCICYLRMPRGPFDNQFDQTWMPEGDRSRNFWVVTPYLDHIGEYEGQIFAEGLQDFVWANLYRCTACHPDRCAPGTNRTILGREMEGICVGRPPVWFWNPDGAAISALKRLLAMEQRARA